METSNNKIKMERILSLTKKLVANSNIKDVRNCPAYSLVKAISNYHLYDIVLELCEGESVENVQSLMKDLGPYININVENTIPNRGNVTIDLKKDAVITFAWDIKRFENCLKTIGDSLNNSFEYQVSNHAATYIYPLGLTIVQNGYHSILTGILKGEGTIESTDDFDLTPMYEQIYFDGTYFRAKSNQKILIKVKRFEIGVLFEIGRIFAENNIN